MKGVSKGLKGEFAGKGSLGGGVAWGGCKGTKRRRVAKSGADEALEDEDAEEAEDEENILLDDHVAAGADQVDRMPRRL